MKHATQAIAAPHRADLQRSARYRLSRDALPQPLMRPGLLAVEAVREKVERDCVQAREDIDRQFVQRGARSLSFGEGNSR